ncbi:MAG TPA: NlpC/P60 family protein [Geobacteraceae bacterium]|nr:NlpC/P60 family protein [Geobacteraceae bacterium]
MKHLFTGLWLLCTILMLAATGCAAQLKETGGLSRLGYTIQVGAFKEVRNAERLTAKLQSAGIEAFYFKKENGVYAVRFGDFPTYDAARNNARKLVADKVIGSFFIAVPQEAVLKRKDPELRAEGGKPPRTKPAGDMGAIAARTAERFVGIPYRWGGDTVVEGMDCSGFVRAVYNLCGVNIPRTSREQFRVGESVGKDDLMDGDLVFFGASADQINHVGIYVGGGRFVHAPKRGDDIKISALDEAYFAKKFIGAKRYF